MRSELKSGFFALHSILFEHRSSKIVYFFRATSGCCGQRSRAWVIPWGSRAISIIVNIHEVGMVAV